MSMSSRSSRGTSAPSRSARTTSSILAQLPPQCAAPAEDDRRPFLRASRPQRSDLERKGDAVPTLPSPRHAQALTRKKATVCSSIFARVAISCAVAASSSAADALRWVTWSIRDIARLTSVTPTACSRDVAETSCTSAAVRWMAGTSAAMIWPDRSATATLRFARSSMAPADCCARSASLRTSLATTAKPRPLSPARAASIAAFRASRFVW